MPVLSLRLTSKMIDSKGMGTCKIQRNVPYQHLILRQGSILEGIVESPATAARTDAIPGGFSCYSVEFPWLGQQGMHCSGDLSQTSRIFLPCAQNRPLTVTNPHMRMASGNIPAEFIFHVYKHIYNELTNGTIVKKDDDDFQEIILNFEYELASQW